MKVILVFTYGISIKDWEDSGLLTREMQLYSQLASQHNIEFSFISYDQNIPENIRKTYPYIDFYPVYKYINKSNNKYINYFRTLTLPKKLEKELRDIDLIKTNQLNGAWIGIILKSILKKPLFIRTGYNLFEFSIKDKKPKLTKLFYYFLTQLSLFCSDIYSVSSNEDKKFIKKYFLNSKNIVLIPNWVNRLQKNAFDNRYKNKILSVGRLETQKNFQSLIKTISSSDIELDLVGQGSLHHELKQLAIHNNSKVNLLGKVPFNQLSEMYKNYKIFVLTSNFEGNPKAVLEAMSNGCLIIAKDTKNLREIIENNVNGLLYENDSELIELITNGLNNINLFNQLTENSYNRIKNNNLLEKIIFNEIKIYNQLIEN